MSELHSVAAVVTGLTGLALGFLVPQLVARIPEPDPDELEQDADADVPLEAPDAVDREPKELYVDLAARPGLAWKCAVAGGVAAALLGLVLGRDVALLVLLPLVPVSVALALIDWRTQLLPTWLIAPSYVVTVLLLLVSWLLADGRDLHDLERSGLGWLVYGGAFFVLWFVYPRGLGYGDVRLAGVLGLVLGWVGWEELLVGIWGGLLLGGVLGGALSLVQGRRAYPFGPFMLLGALVGVAFGQPVMTTLYG